MDVDTIVALSTAPGLGAISVVRLSGPDAFAILEGLAPDGDPRRAEARKATLTRLVSPEDGSALDHAVVTRFPGPNSYTGEDVVEMSCHGGVLVPQLVLDACRVLGARAAEPGEFTRRAYLRGRLDLVQAEAVADVIHARSRAMHRTALGHLDRGLSERIDQLREAIVGLEALLAHHIDFPEEDEAPVPLERVRAEAAAVEDRLERLVATAPEGELLREGALTVLAGRPNVGKSSLYNALLGQSRAIVTSEPGTTRDALEAVVEIGGFPFRLVDTAGLRSAEGIVEELGIEVTHRYLEDADLVLLCVEAGMALEGAERAFLERSAGRAVVLLETKADRVADGAAEASNSEGPGAEIAGVAARIPVSARTGRGLEVLRRTLPQLVYGGLVETRGEAPVLTRRRHARALATASDELRSFGAALEAGVPAEMAAVHLKEAEAQLEDVLGLVDTEDVLDRVFREFCVGK